MFKACLPSMEEQQAKEELISVKWSYGSAMNKHVENFEEILQISETESLYSYKYFLLTLPDEYKSNVTIFFEESQRSNIHLTY